MGSSIRRDCGRIAAHSSITTSSPVTSMWSLAPLERDALGNDSSRFERYASRSWRTIGALRIAAGALLNRPKATRLPLNRSKKKGFWKMRDTVAAEEANGTRKEQELQTAIAATSVIEDAEILHGSLKAGSVAQVVIAIIATIGLLYFLQFVLVTIIFALLLAFILEPLVSQLRRIAIPRFLGALVAVIVAFVLVAGVGYFLYHQVGSFASALPQYSARIQQTLDRIQAPMKRLEKSSQSVTTAAGSSSEAIPVKIQEAPVSQFLFSNSESIGRILLSISFIPVLTYFMLTWKDHVHLATVHLFPKEHRLLAFRAISRISRMLRSFLLANLVVGLIGAASFTTMFWLLGINNFYLIGIMCGFFSLIPSIGMLLALLPAIVGGLGILHETGFVIVVLGVAGTHLVTMDLLYPKLVGKRVLLNPLAVILSMVFWAWIWGGVGLVLAIPIAAAAKIVFDHTDSLKEVGAWLGT